MITPATRRPRRRRPADRLARARGDATWRCSRRSPAERRSSSPTERRSPPATCWHEFGDSHLSFPTLEVDDRTPIRRPTGVAGRPPPLPAGPAGRALRRAPHRRRHGRRGRRGRSSMTVSGARQHLTSLAEHGLVEPPRSTPDEPRRGRPQLTYHVTELADALFPKAYGALPTSCSATSPTRPTTPSTGSSPAAATTASPAPAAAWTAKRSLAGQGRRADARSSTRTATSLPPRRIGRDHSASSSTTARSPPSPGATGRRAPASSSSSAPCCPKPTSSASATWSTGDRHCAYDVRRRRGGGH